MSIADGLASTTSVGCNTVHCTGQGAGQGISMADDTYCWLNKNGENEEPDPLMDEGLLEQTPGLLSRAACRSRSPRPEEQPSGSNDVSSKAEKLCEY